MVRIADMKCLSLKQPYAELLVSGKKTIELRNWNTTFRGKFLIHASKNVDKERSESLGIDYKMLTSGAIIGTAILYDVKQYKNKAQLEKAENKHYADIKRFGFRKYGFIVKNAHRLRSSVPYRGQLNFFEVEYRGS
jgi:hypothetical protein